METLTETVKSVMMSFFIMVVVPFIITFAIIGLTTHQGSYRMKGACRQVCESHGDVKTWEFNSAVCTCADRSAWYIKPVPVRIGHR